MRRGDRHYPPSPPRHYVTPSEIRHDYAMRHRPAPLVYQVYGSMPEYGNAFPGGFSPVRTSSHRNNISPPSSSRPCDDSLYASFSPPRRSTQANQSRGSGGGNSSIFRPKQVSVIVARDRSNDDNSLMTHGPKIESPDSHSQTCRPKETNVSRSSVSAFPAKLHAILSSAEYREYITWLPHGRAWRVLKPKVFEEKIIPKFFRSSKYASFMRQVNGWGFRRITTPGPDFNAYWHELFLRGLPDLCDRMKRPQKNDPELKHEDPPDFYRVSKFSPLPDPDQGSEHDDESRGKEKGKDLPRADETVSADSWDPNDQNADGSKVAINLSDVYDREASRGVSQLTEADLNYLVQQNRALIKQAHLQQSRFHS